MNIDTGKARVWRTRNRRGHIDPRVTTWHFLVPLPDATVIGYAVSHREALAQVCHRLRRAAA